mgnify:CR=1 FL=1
MPGAPSTSSPNGWSSRPASGAGETSWRPPRSAARGRAAWSLQRTEQEGRDARSVARQLLVVWQDDRWQATRGDQIMGRRLDEFGVPTGPAVSIGGSATIADVEFPVVAADPAHGRYLVVWQDARALAARGWDIRGRIVEG